MACLALLLALASVVPSVVEAEPWLCPDCLEETIDRAPDAPDLNCPACGVNYLKEDLSWVVAYANYRVRDIELNFLVMPPDCDRFREDGVQVLLEDGSALWIPWIAVEYLIPRQRILVLVNGKELQTDYPKTRGAPCPEPPPFVFEISDTVRVDGIEPRIVTKTVDSDIAELFFLGVTPEAREAARARFIEEVEAGLHPRLPRTPPKMVREGRLQLPSEPVVSSAEAEIDVRVDDRGRILRVRMAKSSGYPEIDLALISAAQRTFFSSAGEMGVPVPASLVLHYTIRDHEPTVEARPAVPSIWEQ